MFPSKHSSCTTILVGKNATYDGSTIIARNEDAGEAVHPKKNLWSFITKISLVIINQN